MRKEIPLFITALVGVVLILQYFSPNKSINQVESTFMNWAQIVFAFSMILGILNLIRVNGDKIYKRRKNWGLSVIIIVSLFTTAIVGFTNVGSESMYDRKILKTNFPVIQNIAMQVLDEEGIKKGEKYNSLLVALIEGTQKEKTLSSLVPKHLKDSKEQYVKMLNTVRERAEKGIKLTNQMGRTIKKEVRSTLKAMDNKAFTTSIIKTYEDMNAVVQSFNKDFALEDQKVIESNVKSQLQFVLLNPNKKANTNKVLPYYQQTQQLLLDLNDFLLKDEATLALIETSLKSTKNYNDFYSKMSASIDLKEKDAFAELLLQEVSSIYLNEIYRLKAGFTKEKLETLLTTQLGKKIADNKQVMASLTTFVTTHLEKNFSKQFSKYVTKDQDYLKANNLLKTPLFTEVIYDQILNKLLTVEGKDVPATVKAHLNDGVVYKKMTTNKKVIAELAKNTKTLEALGFKKENATFLISSLLVSGKYELTTLELGSWFMRIYEYIYVPLQATMFALLAFFVASASYRAFRARNKEATLLLIAGFIVMLGRVPVGEYLSIDGVISFSQMSQFIMEVPAMSVQSGILIGVALGVISTSLRLILGIERSHLGGD